MDWTEIIIAVIGALGLLIEGLIIKRQDKKITKINSDNNKELQKMKSDHDVLMLKLNNYENNTNIYNQHIVDTISAFLGYTKVYLGNPDLDETYENFAKSASKVLMCLSEESQKNSAKHMIEIIDNIHAIEIGYYDGSWERRERMIKEANKEHLLLCNEFSNLGLKPPTPPQE